MDEPRSDLTPFDDEAINLWPYDLNPVHRYRRFKWLYENQLHWFQQWRNPEEFPTWIVEARKGKGKTRYLAREAVRDMRAGIRVYANFTLRDRLTGLTAGTVLNWLDVLRVCVQCLEDGKPVKFYIDELHLWADSRAFKATPAWFRGWLQQSRHYGAGICGSVQNLRRVEVVVRELVDELRVVKKWYFRLFLLPIEQPWNPWIPLHWVGVVNPDSIGAADMGDAVEYQFERSSMLFARWWGGYDTHELIQVEPWESDEDIDAEVQALTDRAAELVAPGEISAFFDSIP